MEALLKDLRYAARRLRMSPGFTVVAVVTLAIGIGANSAIFSVVYGVLLRSLPFPESQNLVRIFDVRGGNELPVSGPNFLEYAEQDHLFEGVGAYSRGIEFTFNGAGEPRRLDGSHVSAELFDVLRVPVAVGRGLAPQDNEPGAAPVVVLGDALWRSEFGADPAVVGEAISLNGVPHTVIGVMPAGFDFPGRSDLWTPLTYSAAFRDDHNRGAHALGVVARLRPGVGPDRAAAEMRELGDRIAREHATAARSTATARPMQEVVIGDSRAPLLILLGAVGMVLLIACANVANLLLARAAAREDELALRTALGAGRRRLVRQLMTESVLLGLIGGALGLLIAVWGTDLLIALRPSGVPRLDEVEVGLPVVGFTLAISLLTGILFGLVPALQITRGDLANGIREGGRGALSGRRGGRIRNALVIAQTALAVVLLAGAGLLIRSFVSLQQVTPGFEPRGVLAVDLALPEASYPDRASIDRFYRQLEERIANVPGVQSTGAVSALPLSGRDAQLGVYEAGRETPRPGEIPIMQLRVATPGYLETLGTPILRGRGFTLDDREGAPRVLLLNESAAERYFPGQDPLGKRLLLTWSLGPAPEDQVGGEVVGIVGDVRQSRLAQEPEPQVYVAHRQAALGRMDLTVRTSSSPASFAPAVRQAVREIDPHLALGEFRTLEEVVSRSISQPRFYMILLSIFAGAALLLAAIGIFGVISYAIVQRTREIGVRVALGAAPTSVLRLVVGRGLGLALTGLAIGIVGALAATRVLEHLLYGVGPADPATLVVVVVVLTSVALAAAYVPARRATRVDPMVALRGE